VKDFLETTLNTSFSPYKVSALQHLLRNLYSWGFDPGEADSVDDLAHIFRSHENKKHAII